jgi:hypothetical protein
MSLNPVIYIGIFKKNIKIMLPKILPHLSLIFLFLTPSVCWAQKQPKRLPQPQIEWRQNGTEYTFSVKNHLDYKTQMTPDATAAPYLRYHWEFGDGHFLQVEKSETSVKHRYAQRGSFTVRLYLTPCGTIDFIDNPAMAKVDVNASSTPLERYSANPIAFTPNHELRPSEEMVAVIGYKNNGVGTGKGRIYVFFNEKSVSKKVKLLPMEGIQKRLHFGESEIKNLQVSALQNSPFANVKNAARNYLDVLGFEVPNLTPSVQNLFLTFTKIAENSNLLKGNKFPIEIILEANGLAVVIKKEMHLEKSHDPNDITVKPRYMNFRKLQDTALTYRIRFENKGKGAENKVILAVNRPKQADPQKFEFLEASPACPPCGDVIGREPCLKQIIGEKELRFEFHNIYLASSRQKDVDEKQAEGFVSYKLYPRRGLRKTTWTSEGGIDFSGDITPTGAATVKFKPGLSIGPKIALNMDKSTGESNIAVGVVASQYKPTGVYLQFELMTDVTKMTRPEIITNQLSRTRLDNQNCDDCYRDSVQVVKARVKQSGLSFVPLQFRWDISKVLTIGLGASADVFFRDVAGTQAIEIRKVVDGDCILSSYLLQHSLGGNSYARRETQFRYNAFGDLSVGIDQFRLGGRYVFPLNGGNDNRRVYWQFYTQYKF